MGASVKRHQASFLDVSLAVVSTSLKTQSEEINQGEEKERVSWKSSRIREWTPSASPLKMKQDLMSKDSIGYVKVRSCVLFTSGLKLVCG